MYKKDYANTNFKSLSVRKNQDAILRAAAVNPVREVLRSLHTSINGLDEKEIMLHRTQKGNNKITRTRKKSVGKQFVDAFINPFTVILILLVMVSVATDVVIPQMSLLGCNPSDTNPATAVIILFMVALSGSLRFIQERKNGEATQKLLDMVSTTCLATRKETGTGEIPMDDVVVGDIIHLGVGDMVPSDIRILDSRDFFVSQALITGESIPVEKSAAIIENADCALTDYSNIAFMGSNVVSGTAVGVVVANGDRTLFGTISTATAKEAVETNFTKGVNSVSWILIRFMLVMVPLVFFITGVSKGDWMAAILFAISVAVGLTPEMLPVIVTVCLVKGASSLSKKDMIVKNLNTIQNLGAIDVLCMDKTGTLTQNEVVLGYSMNLAGDSDPTILKWAYINSYFQTGYRNLMDKAIIHKAEEVNNSKNSFVNISEFTKIDEIPFDYQRRMISVLAKDSDEDIRLITKGAVDEILGISSWVEKDGTVLPLSADLKQSITHKVDSFNEKGLRVIAVAYRCWNDSELVLEVDDERNMILLGFLAFLDPPKDSTYEAVTALRKHGIKPKILTGDNEKVTRAICSQVDIPVDKIVLGSDLERMSDQEFSVAVEKTDVFAKLSPEQKARIVCRLQAQGHTVGYIGDGINDTIAMKAADVAISVDSAVDVAKESAQIILLEKDLLVLEQGIIEGRKTYANMIKYIKMAASSNFGNMFSVLAASALLPFLPMMSVQLVLLNLMYDLSCIVIPWDNVDDEYLAVPRQWDAASIGKFMIWIGPSSSIFDWTTYSFLYFVLCPMFVSNGVLYNNLATQFSGIELEMLQANYIAMFQAGWFVESIWSQTLVIHMIRTPKIPFIQSRASVPLTLVTFTTIVLLTILPFTGLGQALGFVALPAVYFCYLIPCILLYMIMATVLKRAYVRHYGELL